MADTMEDYFTFCEACRWRKGSMDRDREYEAAPHKTGCARIWSHNQKRSAQVKEVEVGETMEQLGMTSTASQRPIQELGRVLLEEQDKMLQSFCVCRRPKTGGGATVGKGGSKASAKEEGDDSLSEEWEGGGGGGGGGSVLTPAH